MVGIVGASGFQEFIPAVIGKNSASQGCHGENDMNAALHMCARCVQGLSARGGSNADTAGAGRWRTMWLDALRQFLAEPGPVSFVTFQQFWRYGSGKFKTAVGRNVTWRF